MGDPWRKLQLHYLISEQAERPIGVTRWRFVFWFTVNWRISPWELVTDWGLSLAV